MADSLRDELQAVLGSAYAIEDELTGGGMSRVFVAREVALGRRVVVKVVSDERAEGTNLERFQREVRTAAQLRHPHIVPLLAAGSGGGFFYYTMPFVEGKSLRNRLAREGRIPIDEAIRVATDIAGALTYAHAQGVVHRDIKPENILFDSGHALLTDFGLARLMDQSKAGLTRTGMGLGTPLYMSPEQISGGHDVDGRSDVFSLTCVFYEMLTGSAPFAGANIAAVIAARFDEAATDRRIAGSQLPRLLTRVIERGLATDPAKRFTGALEFSVALNAARHPKTRVRQVAVAAALVVFVAGASWFGLQTSKATTKDRGMTPAPPVGSTTNAPAVPQEARRSPSKETPRQPVQLSGAAEQNDPTQFKPSLPRRVDSTAKRLARAAVAFAGLNIEEAYGLVRGVLSPTYLYPVTREERATAYAYMGVMLATLARPDSAEIMFVEALEIDPLIDLDRSRFTAFEIDALEAARQRVFKVGLQALEPTRIDPDRDSVSFFFASTHRGKVILEIISRSDIPRREVLFDGTNDGARVVRWSGRWRNSQIADTGEYELRLTGTSSRISGLDADRSVFRIDREMSGRPDVRLNPGARLKITPIDK